ncbi:MAG: hypothetical protein GY722_06200 [bacterium]|nr:hypothetical protein [bacterium]
MNRTRNIVVAVSAVLLSCLGCASDEKPDSAQCEDAENLIEQIDCYATLATKGSDPSVCDLSSHEGVKYQCHAVVAERLGNVELCDQIPVTSSDHQQLRDVCVSDVAKKTLDDLLCDGIQTVGLRDSCYVKIGRETKNTALCAKIQDPGLRSLCSGIPVVVE